MATWTLADGIGSVELLDVFGDDLTVVNAARVSMAKTSHEMNERDERLIRYLADHQHISPFFHPQVRFRIRMPIFVAREWYRHTIGLTRNEVSRRYVDDTPAVWNPTASELRMRNVDVKQGSLEESIDDASEVSQQVQKMQDAMVKFYEELLAKGVAPEVARCVLPQSMYTEFIETGSLAAYARLCVLRCAPDAQKEIQWYAHAVSECLAAKFPVSWSAIRASNS